MPTLRRTLALVGLVAAGLLHPASLRADTIVLKNGIVYRGTVDRDNTILWIYDGLRRVVLYNSKVQKIESDASLRNLEVFRIEQPLVVHGGSMPKTVLHVDAKPWNDRGRRMFAYEGTKIGKFTGMEQAINEMGPHLVKIRGVDGFWQGQLATSQVPRDVILAILAKVSRTDKNERVRVARFLIEAEWYTEARAELDKIRADFPDDADLRERIEGVRATIAQLDATLVRASVDRLRAAQQWSAAATAVKTFPTKNVAGDLVAQVRDLERSDAARAAADKERADDLRSAGGRLPKESQKLWEKRLVEALKAMTDAPDAVRDRFVAMQKAKAETPDKPEALFALAMSGFVAGSDAAVDDLEAASTLWSMRDLVRSYLASADTNTRAELLEKLDTAGLPPDESTPPGVKKLDVVTRLAQNMPPPLHEDGAKASRIHRVKDDENAEPTEYTVHLPPEYHPLRKYPAVLALHDGTGSKAAIASWSAEASRRGYVVIAPEYLPAGDAGKEYAYTESEHAAIELALRDARRRYSVDSDRVYLAGVLVGGNAAWDFGLAHPDLFAGVVIVSGFPFKYSYRYVANAEKLPMYVALGDLAPASTEFIFGQVLKPLIAKAWDVTYVEYLKRGMEDFPEETPAAFDWMDRRRREPYRKDFEAVTARVSDNRFYGVVVREFQPGRATAPAAAEPLGKNLNLASLKFKTSAVSNLLVLETKGLKRFDVWVSPKLIDFKRKIEVRVNGRSYKGAPRYDLSPLLEDLRLRGDRQQIYWMKVPIG